MVVVPVSTRGQRRSVKKAMKSSTSVERGGAAGGFPSLAAPSLIGLGFSSLFGRPYRIVDYLLLAGLV